MDDERDVAEDAIARRWMVVISFSCPLLTAIPLIAFVLKSVVARRGYDSVTSAMFWMGACAALPMAGMVAAAFGRSWKAAAVNTGMLVAFGVAFSLALGP